MEQQRVKTRHQSLFEYLEALQLEHIQAEVRRKIYPKPKDKVFWEKVLSHKKEKIIDIASRNGLPSIFDDELVKNQYRSKIFPETGFPTFFYKDDIDKAEFELKDFKYYFSAGSEVKILQELGKIVIGKIVKAPKFGEDVVLVRIKGSSEETLCSITYVTRIL